MSEFPKIIPHENGSLEVAGLEDLQNSRGEKLKTKEKIYLCRCGHSQNKPFCDGTHKKAGFSSQNPRHHIPDRKDAYPGKEVTIFDNRGICSHTGYCTEKLPSVFILKGNPWVVPDGASPGEIKKVVKMCPSGALSYGEGPEPGRKESLDYYGDLQKAQIVTEKDGPYHVRGQIETQGLDTGNGASKDHYTLCRCGASKYKPRCDGAHHQENFVAD